LAFFGWGAGDGLTAPKARQRKARGRKPPKPSGTGHFV
jgi:hypothetical protein